MKPDTRLAGLARITGLIMDQHLADLRAKKAAQTATRQHIEILNRPIEADDMAPVAAMQVGLRYAAWADMRKAVLNVTLARQTGAVLAAEDDARLAFARNAVMQKLREKR